MLFMDIFRSETCNSHVALQHHCCDWGLDKILLKCLRYFIAMSRTSWQPAEQWETTLFLFLYFTVSESSTHRTHANRENTTKYRNAASIRDDNQNSFQETLKSDVLSWDKLVLVMVCGAKSLKLDIDTYKSHTLVLKNTPESHAESTSSSLEEVTASHVPAMSVLLSSVLVAFPGCVFPFHSSFASVVLCVVLNNIGLKT